MKPNPVMIRGIGSLKGLGVSGEVFLIMGTDSAAAAYGTRAVIDAIKATAGKLGIRIITIIVSTEAKMRDRYGVP
jgi:formylmethanofuran:tetrahydromethanopterin formyltransferase